MPTNSPETKPFLGASPRALAPESVRPETTTVLGVPLALIDYDGTMECMDSMVARRKRGYICVASVHTVMGCQEDPELRQAILNSSLTVPDGQPLVWAMNALGHDLSNRVYGPELMKRYCERARGTGVRM